MRLNDIILYGPKLAQQNVFKLTNINKYSKSGKPNMYTSSFRNIFSYTHLANITVYSNVTSCHWVFQQDVSNLQFEEHLLNASRYPRRHLFLSGVEGGAECVYLYACHWKARFEFCFQIMFTQVKSCKR